MPLQILFGDDEHTAKDGPYNRVLKTRKWLYLGAGLATLVAIGLYDEAAAKSLLRVVALPTYVVRNFLFVGLTYLLIQYVMLVAQLVVSYDLVLRERLAFRREDDLAAGRQKVADAQRAISEYRDERPSITPAEIARATDRVDLARAKLVEIQTRLSNAPVAAPGSGVNLDGLAELGAKAAITDSEAHLVSILERKEQLDAQRAEEDPVKTSLLASLKVAADALSLLQREDPAQRLGYRKFEMAIDGLRVFPPAAFAASALVGLGLSAL